MEDIYWQINKTEYILYYKKQKIGSIIKNKQQYEWTFFYNNILKNGIGIKIDKIKEYLEKTIQNIQKDFSEYKKNIELIINQSIEEEIIHYLKEKEISIEEFYNLYKIPLKILKKYNIRKETINFNIEYDEINKLIYEITIKTDDETLIKINNELDEKTCSQNILIIYTKENK